MTLGFCTTEIEVEIVFYIQSMQSITFSFPKGI
jgi:hypothetical protein